MKRVGISSVRISVKGFKAGKRYIPMHGFEKTLLLGVKTEHKGQGGSRAMELESFILF